MSAPTKLAKLGIALALLSVWFAFMAQSASRAGSAALTGDEQVTLTLTSTCGSASVQVKGRGVVTTPVSVTFPRGKTVQLRALDDSLAQCDALTVVSPFSRFVVNQTAMPEGKRRVTLTLDRDA